MKTVETLGIVGVLLGISCLFLVTLNQNAARGSSHPIAQPAGEREAREMWEKLIAAKGGRGRLYQVRSVHILCQATEPYRVRGYEGLGTRNETLFVLPNKFWSWTDDRPGSFGLDVMVYNGERNVAWWASHSDPGNVQQSAASDDYRYALVNTTLLYLMENQWIRPAPVYLEPGTLAGKKIVILHAVWDKYKAEYYLDPVTHLPLKVKIRGLASDGVQRVFASMALREYVSVDGIQMPQREGGYDADTTNPRLICTHEFNVDYDATIFNHAPRIEDGPEAWRPKRGRQR